MVGIMYILLQTKLLGNSGDDVCQEKKNEVSFGRNRMVSGMLLGILF